MEQTEHSQIKTHDARGTETFTAVSSPSLTEFFLLNTFIKCPRLLPNSLPFSLCLPHCRKRKRGRRVMSLLVSTELSKRVHKVHSFRATGESSFEIVARKYAVLFA